MDQVNVNQLLFVDAGFSVASGVCLIISSKFFGR